MKMRGIEEFTKKYYDEKSPEEVDKKVVKLIDTTGSFNLKYALIPILLSDEIRTQYRKKFSHIYEAEVVNILKSYRSESKLLEALCEYYGEDPVKYEPQIVEVLSELHNGEFAMTLGKMLLNKENQRLLENNFGQKEIEAEAEAPKSKEQNRYSKFSNNRLLDLLWDPATVIDEKLQIVKAIVLPGKRYSTNIVMAFDDLSPELQNKIKNMQQRRRQIIDYAKLSPKEKERLAKMQEILRSFGNISKRELVKGDLTVYEVKPDDKHQKEEVGEE